MAFLSARSTSVLSSGALGCRKNSGAVSTDILHFRARVLAVYGQGMFMGQPLTPDTVLAVWSSDRTVRFFPRSPQNARARGPCGRGGGQQSVVMPPCRGTGTFGRPPIGWPQRAPVVRCPRLTSGPRGPHLPCRSTSLLASVRETPNAEARGCVRQRRTPRVDGRS